MKQLSEGEFKMTAQTMFGFEEILSDELKNLGAKNIEKHNRAVSFAGDLELMYKANLCLRTALRILVPICEFEVFNEQDLYDNIKKIRWEEYLGTRDTVAINCSLSSPLFTHSQFLEQKTKDGIADYFKEKYGKRPSVDLISPTLRVNVYIYGSNCLVSLDSSGDSLHKRGYRDKSNIAPINEVLAAGLVLLSGWDKQSNFIDPMCGSGTILIEAALLASNTPPGIYKSHFGFMNWKYYDSDIWHKVFNQSIEQVNRAVPKIVGGEISRNVSRKAVSNIYDAEISDMISIQTAAFEDLEVPEGTGTLIINPPYGERMDKDEDIELIYKQIGDTLKKKWSGYTAWVITSNLEAAKHIHLTPKPKIKVFNGSLECRFMKYELYSGTKRVFKEKN